MNEQQEENVLNVIMYLFKHHMDEGTAIIVAPEKLSYELESAGFSKRSINMAFNWLEKLSLNKQDHIQPASADSIRVFSDLEKNHLDLNCQNYIHYLTQADILNFSTREHLIDQLLQLNDINIDISLIKWVTLLVLYNQDNTEAALKKMELLVLNDQEDTLH